MTRSNAAAAMILLVSTFSMTAQSLDLSTEADLKKAVTQFAGVAGAWYINRNCSFLDENLVQEFDWNVGQANMQLTRAIGANNMTAIQRDAKNAAEQSPLDECGGNAQGLVVQAVVSARSLTQELGGQPFAPGNTMKPTATQIYRAAFVAYLIEQKCSHLPSDIAPDVMSAFQSGQQRMIKEKGQQFVSDIEGSIDIDRLFEELNACSNNSHAVLTRALPAIKLLQNADY